MKKVIECNIGVWGFCFIIEEIMMDVMFDIFLNENIEKVIIIKEVVELFGELIVIYKDLEKKVGWWEEVVVKVILVFMIVVCFIYYFFKERDYESLLSWNYYKCSGIKIIFRDIIVGNSFGREIKCREIFFY